MKTAVSGEPRTRCAGNAIFRCRSKRLIPAYQLHAAEIRQLLTTALNTAIALQIPEQEIIKERLQALDPE